MKKFVYLFTGIFIISLIFSCKEKSPQEQVAEKFFTAINENNLDIIHQIAYETFDQQLSGQVPLFRTNYGQIKNYELYNQLDQKEDENDFKYLFYKCSVEKTDEPVYSLLKLLLDDGKYKIIGSYYLKSEKLINLLPKVNVESKKFIENYFNLLNNHNYEAIGNLLAEEVMSLKDTLTALLKEQEENFGKITDYNFYRSTYIPNDDTLELYLIYRVETDSVYYYDGFLLKMYDEQMKLKDYAYGGTEQYLYDYFGL